MTTKTPRSFVLQLFILLTLVTSTGSLGAYAEPRRPDNSFRHTAGPELIQSDLHSAPLSQPSSSGQADDLPPHVVAVKTLESGDDLVHGFIYHDGYLWASTRTSPAKILKIDPNTLEYQKITLSSGLDAGEDIIVAGGYIWIVTFTQTGRLIKIHPETLEWEVAISFGSNLAWTDSLEYAFGSLWVGGNYHKIAKVNLADLTYQTYNLTGFENNSFFHALTSSDKHLWGSLVHYNSSGYATASSIVRIDPNNPSNYKHQRLDQYLPDDIAYTDSHLYVASEESPFTLFKFNDDVAPVKTTGVDATSYGTFINPSDPAHVWVTYAGSTGKVVKYNQNLEVAKTYSFPTGIKDANEIAFDGADHMFVTSWDQPAKIVKIDLRPSLSNAELSDDFNDNQRNAALWVTHRLPTGPAANETNQRLEVTIPADSSGSTFAAGYSSICKLQGDFDIQVDYNLLTWPANNGVRVGLTTDFAALERVSVGPNEQRPLGEVYSYDLGTPLPPLDASGNSSGTLRLTRVGTTLTGYASINGQWVSIGSSTVSTDDTQYNLHVWSHDYAFGDQQVTVAFDNFVVNQGRAVCPTSTISGRVTDSSGQPIPDVTISVAPGNLTTLAAAGTYMIADLAPGTYTLTASKDGYTFSGPFTVTVPPDATQDFVGTKVTVPPPSEKTPLIFIPGIMGSYLNEANSSGEPINLWPGCPEIIEICAYSHRPLTLDPTKDKPNIIATDAIREFALLFSIYESLLSELSSRGGYVEYKVDKPNLTSLDRCEEARDEGRSDTTLFVFAYDWRKDNAENADLLKRYIDCVRSIHSESNIDILTHSMGGLIARRYLLDHPSDHHVNRLITIAAPWLGTPKATYVIETGSYDFMINAIVLPSELKALAEFFDGAHQLLPSRSYFDLAGTGFEELGWDINKNNNNIERYNYDQFVQLLNYRHERSLPGATNLIFHDHPSSSNPAQDDWSADTPGDVQYFHIYGIRSQEDTVEAVLARAVPSCKGIFCDWVNTYFDVTMTRGDNTVPALSAARCLPPSSIYKIWNCSGDRGLNAKQSTLIPFYGPTDREVEHTGLVSNDDVINYVLAILQGALLQQQSAMISQSVPSVQPSYYLRVTGTSTVSVTDDLGNIGSTATGSLSSSSLDVTGLILGETAHLLVMPTYRTYTITLYTDINPVALDLTRGTSITTTQAIRYRDLALPSHVTATLKITPQGVEDLRYDANGDGTFETTVQPTVSVSGPDANDTEPPTIAISRTGALDRSAVTITATDSGTGVKAVYYSLDGTTYQRYNGPVTIDAVQSPMLYVFADDNVANRSSLMTYQLAQRSYLPLTQR